MTPPLSNDPTGRIGGDLKYGITQNLTADLTVNTDFAQVEVDEQQVNLTRFNLFFPEKRDFFLEGLGMFAFAGPRQLGPRRRRRRHAVPLLQPAHRPGSVARDPVRAGGRVTGKAGKCHLRRDQRADGRDEAVAKRRAGELHRAARQARHPAAQQHRRHVHPSDRDAGRTGSNDGAGVDVAMSFYQNVRLDAYLAGTQDRRT